MRAGDQDLRYYIGSVFEQVAKRIFHARLHPTRNFKKGDVNPDLEADEFGAWVEVRSSRLSSRFKFSPVQFEGYRQMIDGDPFPYDKILFAFFGHDLDEIHKRYQQKPLHLLARDLVLHTAYLLVLDFSVVERVIAGLPLRNYQSWEEIFLWEHEINRKFIANPAGELKSLGFHSDYFAVTQKCTLLRWGLAARKFVPSVWVLQKSNVR